MELSLKQILSGDGTHLQKLIELTAKAAKITPDARRQALAEQLLTQLWQDNQVDKSLLPLSQQLTSSCSQWIAHDDSFYLKPDHPLITILDRLLIHTSHWYPHDSKPSQQFFEKLNQASTQIANKPDPAILEEFLRWADGEAKRASMLAERLGENEAGNMRLAAIECQAIDLLNEHLAGRPFPIDCIEGITRVLKSELQHSLVNSANNPDAAPFWKHWQRLLPVLGQVFPHTDNHVEDQVLYGQIPPLMNELERSLQLPQGSPSAYHPWVDQLCEELMAAIQKKNPATRELPELPYPEGYNNSRTRVTQSLLQQSQALQPGDWLRFSDENDNVIRCMLAYKSADANQLLFVDQAGRKVMNKSLKDMALCLSTGIAVPLKNPDLKKRIEQLLGKLLALGQKVQEQQQARAQQVAELAAKQQEDAAERALQQEQESKKIAAQKAFTEAKALAEESQKRAQENSQQQQNTQQNVATKEAKLITAQAEVTALKVGAWLELIGSDGKVQKCKLSVILGGTGKYIFVDQLGRKLAEFQRDQLVELMQKDGLRLLRQGGDFEDQLAKVIRGLRKDISS